MKTALVIIAKGTAFLLGLAVLVFIGAVKTADVDHPVAAEQPWVSGVPQ